MNPDSDSIPQPDANFRYPKEAVRQVTHRNFSVYLDTFHLSEINFANVDTVVDVGAGFSSFAEEVRERYPGIRAIAIDPVYGLLKTNRAISPTELENRAGIHLDFDVQYRREKSHDDYRDQQRQDEQVFYHFANEMQQHPASYIAASHQQIPLPDKSADLVLASNSILRRENSPEIIKQALQECARILKNGGEIRVAGDIACFVVNAETGELELWYNGTLEVHGSWIEEYKATGRYTDPRLLQALKDLEAEGIKFHCVILKNEENSDGTYRFDTLILRKDDAVPRVDLSKYLPEFSIQTRKLHFQDSEDGFQIPSIIEP